MEKKKKKIVLQVLSRNSPPNPFHIVLYFLDAHDAFLAILPSSTAHERARFSPATTQLYRCLHSSVNTRSFARNTDTSAFLAGGDRPPPRSSIVVLISILCDPCLRIQHVFDISSQIILNQMVRSQCRRNINERV